VAPKPTSRKRRDAGHPALIESYRRRQSLSYARDPLFAPVASLRDADGVQDEQQGYSERRNHAQREHGHWAGRDPVRFDQPGGRAHGHCRHQICNPKQLPQDEAFAVIGIRECHRNQGRGGSDHDVAPTCGQREQAWQNAEGVQREEGEAGDPLGLQECQGTRVQGQNVLAK
jgi:hypothetical protein